MNKSTILAVVVAVMGLIGAVRAGQQPSQAPAACCDGGACCDGSACCESKITLGCIYGGGFADGGEAVL